MDEGFEAYLRVGDLEFGRRDAELLRAIAREGSLNAAADELGRSYSRAHTRVSDLERELGSLVERRRGGAGGGGSQLTETGRALLARFDRLAAALEGTAMTEKVELVGEVRDRDGALATVHTPAGTVRAVLADPADRVRVAFRADAVTLHAPDGAPNPAETSARNRFEGTVKTVERAAAIAEVTVDIGTGTPLAVQITVESLDQLGIGPGDPVVASFKATATRATPAPAQDW